MSIISNLEDYRTPTPNTENSKVTNTRKYKDVREREYLTTSEIERISKAGRHGHRDCTIIMIAYHHTLRKLKRDYPATLRITMMPIIQLSFCRARHKLA